MHGHDCYINHRTCSEKSFLTSVPGIAEYHLGTRNQDEPVPLSVDLNSGSNFIQSTLRVLFARCFKRCRPRLFGVHLWEEKTNTEDIKAKI